MLEEKKEYLIVLYQQYNNDTWDAWVQFYPEIKVEKAKSLVEAKVFIDILTHEQLEDFKIIKEIINYAKD